MAAVGVHVELTVRLRREGTVLEFTCKPTLVADARYVIHSRASEKNLAKHAVW